MSDEIHPPHSPEATVSVPHRSLLRKIFVGPHGLRAGWKVLIFVLILFAVSFCLRPLRKLSGPVNRELPVPPGTALLYELPRALAVLIATGIMARFIGYALQESRRQAAQGTRTSRAKEGTAQKAALGCSLQSKNL